MFLKTDLFLQPLYFFLNLFMKVESVIICALFIAANLFLQPLYFFLQRTSRKLFNEILMKILKFDLYALSV